MIELASFIICAYFGWVIIAFAINLAIVGIECISLYLETRK